MPILNVMIITIKRFNPLKISLNAINGAGREPDFESFKNPFFLYLSPVLPFLIASTGVYFFISLVERNPKNITTATTTMALTTESIIEPSSDITIVSLVFSIRRFEKGKEHINPITAPSKASARYFTRYSIRIPALGIPIAFMMPISLNSSLIVKDIVNLSINNAMMIRQILTIMSIPATTISIR